MDRAKLEAEKQNYRFQKFIAGVGAALMLMKFIAWVITDSVSILTDALESIVNVIAGIVGVYALYLTMQPADANHPYGHGRVELISSSMEGSMILLAGALIIVESVNRFISPQEIDRLDIGLVLVAFAALVNFLMGYKAIRMGRSSGSIALEASGKHLCTDTFDSIGILIGLSLVYIGDSLGYDWYILDPLTALLFGAFIIITGVRVLRRSMYEIMDTVDEDALRRVTRCINKTRTPDVIEVHHLRVTKYGVTMHVDAHMTVPADMTVEESQKLIDSMCCNIKGEIGDDTDITIMTEPCDRLFCKSCQKADCTRRSAPFVSVKYLGTDNITKCDTHYLKIAREKGSRDSGEDGD